MVIRCLQIRIDPLTSGARIFRRAVIVDAEPGIVRAGIEDDFHHYEIALRHLDGVVTSVKANSVRTPFTTCTEAGAHLDQLAGHALSTRPSGLPDPHHQCTHMFELAAVALAQAVRGGRRRYDIAVPQRELGGDTIATLHRDGVLALQWDLAGDDILRPAPWGGRNVRSVLKWAEAECADEMLEAVRVLRRGVHVSTGRSVPHLDLTEASELQQVRGACYVFQPVRVERAVRNRDSRRDFTDAPASLLSDFHSIGEPPHP